MKAKSNIDHVVSMAAIGESVVALLKEAGMLRKKRVVRKATSSRRKKDAKTVAEKAAPKKPKKKLTPAQIKKLEREALQQAETAGE